MLLVKAACQFESEFHGAVRLWHGNPDLLVWPKLFREEVGNMLCLRWTWLCKSLLEAGSFRLQESGK